MTLLEPSPSGAAPAISQGLIVLDANIVLGWCFGRAIPREMRALLLHVRREGAQAPEMLRWEAGRVIERRAVGRRLSAQRAAWFRGFFAGLPIVYDPIGVETQYTTARELAKDTGLTVKDASYLELALRTSAPLATRDRALCEAARRCGVRVEPKRPRVG